MRAGLLRHTLVIQRAVETTTALGDRPLAWATYTTRRAALLSVAGGEAPVGGHETARQRRSYEVRFDSMTAGILDTDRVVTDGKTFGITAVFDPDGRRARIQIDVLEQPVTRAGS